MNQDKKIEITPIAPQSFPVATKEQLGQEILRTTARTADPDTIQIHKITKRYPTIEKKTVLNEEGKLVEVEAIIGWEDMEFEIPIRQQSEYHETINDDIARAFLPQEDYFLYLDNGNYCLALKSFAIRYELKLAPHHNHVCDAANQMVAGSGAVEGQRVTLAKTDIAKTMTATATMKDAQELMGKKKPGFLDSILGGI